ncbi:hypothetical protein FQR65_LT20844 [Abscondita terminalis]|nr:hypothetical protein FQR65_LT20844 [Abscondita terminalis]
MTLLEFPGVDQQHDGWHASLHAAGAPMASSFTPVAPVSDGWRHRDGWRSLEDFSIRRYPTATPRPAPGHCRAYAPGAFSRFIMPAWTNSVENRLELALRNRERSAPDGFGVPLAHQCRHFRRFDMKRQNPPIILVHGFWSAAPPLGPRSSLELASQGYKNLHAGWQMPLTSLADDASERTPQIDLRTKPPRAASHLDAKRQLRPIRHITGDIDAIAMQDADDSQPVAGQARQYRRQCVVDLTDMELADDIRPRGASKLPVTDEAGISAQRPAPIHHDNAAAYPSH